MNLRERGIAIYRALREQRRITILGPVIDASQLRAVLRRIPGDIRSARVLGPDEFAPFLRALTPLSPYLEPPLDLTFDAVIVRQDHLTALAPPLLDGLRRGYACAFANTRFALLLPRPATAPRPEAAAVMARIVALTEGCPVAAPRRTGTSLDCAILMTTFNRPAALKRSLPQLAGLGCAVVVVDDGSAGAAARENAALCDRFQVTRLVLPENRGLAAALNVGLAYLLADRSLGWISYFQDDVDVAPNAMAELRALGDPTERPLLTGYDADEHPAARQAIIAGHPVLLKSSSPAVHLHAHVAYWKSVLPIPSEYIGAPRRRWEASLEDYWIVNHAPQALTKRGLMVTCLPGRVRTFLHHAADSTWNNPNQPDPPLVNSDPP
jgi:hypothetical protein